LNFITCQEILFEVLTCKQQLKQRVRNVIDPGRNLGHVDGKKAIKEGADGLAISSPAVEKPKVASESAPACSQGVEGEACEDCQ
jgi:hypothetical protein